MIFSQHCFYRNGIFMNFWTRILSMPVKGFNQKFKLLSWLTICPSLSFELDLFRFFFHYQDLYSLKLTGDAGYFHNHKMFIFHKIQYNNMNILKVNRRVSSISFCMLLRNIQLSINVHSVAFNILYNNLKLMGSIITEIITRDSGRITHSWNKLPLYHIGGLQPFLPAGPEMVN